MNIFAIEGVVNWEHQVENVTVTTSADADMRIGIRRAFPL